MFKWRLKTHTYAQRVVLYITVLVAMLLFASFFFPVDKEPAESFWFPYNDNIHAYTQTPRHTHN